MGGMTVRIAVVGGAEEPDARQALDALLGPDAQWWRVPATAGAGLDLRSADGIWLTTAATVDGASRSATQRARGEGVPVLEGPPAGGGTPWAGGALSPDALAGFADSARRRAWYRESWEGAAALMAAQAAAEAEPRAYVHQMRGPRHRWWRPLLAWLVAVPAWLLLAGLLTAVFGVAGLAPDGVAELGTDPWGSLYGNLVIAALAPATMLGLWAGHRRDPRRVLSVARRFRWGWASWCAAVVTPVWVAYLVLTWFVFEQEVLPRSQQWVGLVVVSLLTTPLQAAAEEIAFRGGLVQTVGSWFRSPVVALVATTAVSTAAFVAAHGSFDPWIAIEIGSLAVAGCYLAWRTGGLEAVIVVHVVNNLLITVSGAVLGGLEESYVDTDTTGSPVSAVTSVVVTALVTALLLALARRRGVAPRGWLTPARG